MTIYEFTALTIDERAQILWDQGKFLDSYSSNEMKVNLYFLADFFVEVEMNSQATSILEIIPFKRGFRLDKYIEKIKLDIS